MLSTKTSFSPDTVGELETLEETLVWRWYATEMKRCPEHTESDLSHKNIYSLSTHESPTLQMRRYLCTLLTMVRNTIKAKNVELLISCAR